MDQRTRNALEASIKHWEENVKAETTQDASVDETDCALCMEFTGDYCEGCPVAEKMGHPYCRGTPYYEAASRFCRWNDDENHADKLAFRAAAQAELDFLISLRPAEQEA